MIEPDDQSWIWLDGEIWSWFRHLSAAIWLAFLKRIFSYKLRNNRVFAVQSSIKHISIHSKRMHSNSSRAYLTHFRLKFRRFRPQSFQICLWRRIDGVNIEWRRVMAKHLWEIRRVALQPRSLTGKLSCTVGIVPALGDPRRERPPAVCGHVINVPTHVKVKLPLISGHLPNEDADSHLLVVSTCYNGHCKKVPRFGGHFNQW